MGQPYRLIEIELKDGTVVKLKPLIASDKNTDALTLFEYNDSEE